MHRGRRRHPAENAICRKSGFASRPFRRRIHATIYNRDGSVPRMAWPRKAYARSCEFLPFFDPVTALRIDDRHEADDAAIAAIPIPREERESTAADGGLLDSSPHLLA